jgi:hypothetical protein
MSKVNCNVLPLMLKPTLAGSPGGSVFGGVLTVGMWRGDDSSPLHG